MQHEAKVVSLLLLLLSSTQAECSLLSRNPSSYQGALSTHGYITSASVAVSSDVDAAVAASLLASVLQHQTRSHEKWWCR
jgi:hypothetical protein